MNNGLNWLNELSGLKLKNYKLDGIKNLLILLNEPEKKLKFIHIAGTNGKGSVARFCFETLVATGLKVGLFISPHILCLNERIQINNELITNSDLINLINLVKPHVDELKKHNIFCSQFDVLTAIALKHFYLNKCDYVVLEAGMGGRLDSTNIILKPELAIITKIDLDHVKELGNSLKKIAIEKAGILKQNGTCVCSLNQSKIVLNVLQKVCQEKNVKFVKSIEPKNVVCLFEKNYFEFENEIFETKLAGSFQIENAALALTALLELNVEKKIIKTAFKKTFWPARFEIFKTQPLIVLDGAHNVAGLKALTSSILACNLTLKIGVFSMLNTKNYELALKQIKKMKLSNLVLTQMDGINVVELKKLELIASKIKLNFISQPNWHKAIKLAKKLATKNGIIFVFGSLYFAAQVRSEILNI